MKKIFKCALLVSLFVIFCSDISTAQVSKELQRAHKKWLHRVNKNSKRLDRLYLKQSLLITQDETVFGQMPIMQLVAQKREFYKSLSSSHSIKLFEHSDRKVLDIGNIFMEDENDMIIDTLFYVIAWRRVGDDWFHEVDIIFPADKIATGGGELNRPRSAWIQYANSDQVELLANGLFLPDGMYLNNSELSKGHPAIARRLEFMKNPNFHINLETKELYAVEKKTVIDIGNWITNEFVGYYLIIWKKDENDSWKIFLYFNF